MVRKKIFYYILSLGISAQAQNLVPNGDFEIYSTCPNNISQIKYAIGWGNADTSRGSPDYYNACDSGANVPDTFFGYQQECCAGKGFAGIYAFNYNFPNDGREYIQVRLTDTLKAGKKYLASMLVNACDNYNYAVATLGMYFTSTAVQGPSTVGFLNVPSPQVKNTTLLSDTMNWMLVQDTVVGTGSELFLTIGNFSCDSLSDTVRVYHMGYMHNNDYAYYYIDHVRVIDIATIGIESTEKAVGVNVYPNPNPGNFTLQYDLKADAILEITDVSGKPVGKYILSSASSHVKIANEEMESGIYIYCVTSDKTVIKTGKIVVMK